jgi:hypothetical protein
MSAIDRSMMVVETGSSTGSAASPNAPPAAPDAVASQDDFLKARMAVTTHDDQIETGIGCNRQDRRLNIHAISFHALDARREAAPRQMCHQGGHGYVRGYVRIVDADDSDSLRTSQKRRCVTKGTRRQAASVPCNADVLRLKRALVRIGNKKHRAAGLKKYFLRKGVVVRVTIGLGLQHDCQIVEPCQGAHGCCRFGRDACKPPQAIGNTCVSDFSFEHRECCISPGQRALAVDLEHGGDRCRTVSG